MEEDLYDDPYDVTPAEVLAAFPPGYVQDFWFEWAIQRSAERGTAWSALSSALQHVSVRELPHIKKLDDCFGDFEMPKTQRGS